MRLLPTEDVLAYYGKQPFVKTLKTITNKDVSRWSTDRQWNAYEQALLNVKLAHLPNFRPLEVDGLPGPATQYAVELYQNWSRDNADLLPKTPLTRPVTNHSPDPQFHAPTQRNAATFFGPAGSPACSARTPNLPYSLRMDGTLSPTGAAHMKGKPSTPNNITRIALHERLHDSFLAIMSQVLTHYGSTSIRELGLDQFAGSYNYRPMRGGTQLSMHAYGAAVDFDAQRNSLRETAATARFARPDYKPFVDAFYDHGWISLGRERNFDFMHFQAARLA